MISDLPSSPAMNQEIFRLGLSVETVSTYLLCCALADGGRPVTHQDLLTVWTGTPEALSTALAELTRHAIVAPDHQPEPNARSYRLLPSARWHRP